ncbi:MAG: DUF2585 family protein [Planctomycetia bacterium]
MDKHGLGAMLQTVALGCLCVLLVNGLMGQPLYCRCGALNIVSLEVFSRHNSQHLLDPYSLTHAMHGVLLAGLFRLIRWSSLQAHRFQAVIVMETLWELLENSPMVIQRYRTATSSLDYSGDSIVNSFGDILSCSAGYLVFYLLGSRKSTVIFIASELLLVLTIRDCLLLNILMLAWPIETIKAWQLEANF